MSEESALRMAGIRNTIKSIHEQVNELQREGRDMPDESAKHTPGPWTYHIGLDYTEFFDASGDTIFFVYMVMDEALARLIAATPELLEACEKAQIRLLKYSPSPRRDATITKLEAAIAKATIEG